MGRIWVKRTGIVLLAFFMIINLFLFTSSRLNADGIPGIGNWKVLSVLTGSMEPAINTGDMVIVKRYESTVPQTGDVVTYWKDDQSRSLITHRVIQRLENGYLQTKGDANQEADGGWTDPNRLIGKVIFTIPFAATLQQVIKQPLVMLLILAGFVIYLVSSKRRATNQPGNSQEPIQT
ncbi:signal peptidase I [Brevibacillus fortis]|uniref:signal peptidase I n=1 Tax=Brevibacillus fortis TaxID=2126352 RepID=UPI002E1BCAE1|nr:signal peptidase I [Brevibacillus fortis]